MSNQDETRHDAGDTDPGQAEKQPPKTSQRRPRRRRRLMWSALILIMVLIIALPHLAATSPGRRAILAMVNQKLTGRLDAQSFGLSWLGPCKVEQLRVSDPTGRTVLTVEKATLAQGLLSTLMSLGDLDQLDLETVQAQLYVTKDYDISLLQAFGAPKASGADAGKEHRDWIDLQAPKLKAAWVNSQLELQALTDVHAQRRVATSDRGEEVLTLKSFTLKQDKGQYHIEANADGNLGALLDVGLHQQGGAGRIALDLKGTFGSGQVAGEFSSRVQEASFSRPQTPAAAPISFALAGQAQSSGDVSQATVQISGDIGDGEIGLTYDGSKKSKQQASENLLSALLTGSDIGLLPLEVTADARLDLSAIARAAPALVKLRQDARLKSGELRIDGLQARGGAQPQVLGTVAVSGVTAEVGGRTLTFEPLSLAVDAALKSKVGLDIQHAQFKAPFADVQASGNASNLQAHFRAELDTLQQQLNQILRLDDLDFKGRMDGQLTVARSGDEQMRVKLSALSDNLQIRHGDRRLALASATLEHEGHMTLAEGKLTRIFSTGTKVNLDGQVTGQVSGWYDISAHAFAGDLNFGQINLAYLADKLQYFGVTALRPFAGDLALQTRADRAGKEAEIVLAGGSVQTRSLAHDGQPLGPNNLSLKWTQAKVNPGTGDFRIEDADLSGEDVAAAVDLAYSHSEQPTTLKWEDIESALLRGQALRCPDLTLELAGSMDLAAMTRGLAELLDLPTHVQSGKLQIQRLKFQGGTAPTVQAALRLEDFRMQHGEAPLVLGFASAAVDARHEPGSGLICPQIEIKSDMASVDASGSSKQLDLKFRADLGRLRQSVGPFMEGELPELAGQLSGQAKLDRVNDEKIKLTMDSDLSKLRYTYNGRAQTIDRASIKQAGHVALKAGRPQKVVAERMNISVDDRLALAGSGWFDLDQYTFQTRVDVSRADLDLLAEQASIWNLGDFSRYSGQVALQADLQRSDPNGPIATSGSATAQGVKVDQRPLPAGRIHCQWTDAVIHPQAMEIRAKLVKLDSAVMKATVQEPDVKLGENLVLSGQVTASADLEPSLSTVRQITQWDALPAIGGRLSLDGRCRMSAGMVTAVGNGGISDFSMVLGDETIQEKKLEFDYQADIHPQKELIALKQFKVGSRGLSASVRGNVQEYKSACVLALQGEYDTAWEQITAILHRFVPATVDVLALAGQGRGEFTVSGPIFGKDARPISPKVAGNIGLGWSSAEVFGLSVGQANLTPTLRDGQVIVKLTEIPTAGGTMRLGGYVDLRATQPTIRIPGQIHILEDVEINREFADSLLSRINPIFSGMTAIEGLVSLRSQDVTFPLGKAVTSHSQGTGYLDLTRLKVQPAGLLAELLRLGGLTSPGIQTVKVSGVDFKIIDGRIAYDDFTMTFVDKFDMRFYGSVGLDDTLDLSVSIPLRSALFDHIKVSKDLAPILDTFGGSRVDIPIVGTRQKPKLDLSAISLGKLLTPKADIIPNLEDLLRGPAMGGEPDPDGGEKKTAPTGKRKRKTNQNGDE